MEDEADRSCVLECVDPVSSGAVRFARPMAAIHGAIDQLTCTLNEAAYVVCVKSSTNDCKDINFDFTLEAIHA
jgi:hypothetical protein